MSLVECLAGRYTATWNALAMGQAAEGWRISTEYFKRLVMGDAAGDAPQNAIYRGRGQMIEYVLIEAAKAAIATLVEPYGSIWQLGVIGQVDVGYGTGGDTVTGASKQLVLTSITGTPSYIQGQATITLPLSIIAENYPVSVLFAPNLKEIPMRQRVYPNSSGSYGSET